MRKEHKKSPAKLCAVRLVVFALAIIMIISGFINGSADDVLIKAVNICMECIGLG